MPPIDKSKSEAKKTASTMTFRLDDDLIEELRKESQNREISLNTLANQILRQHVIWDIYLSKVGMIPIAKPVVSAIFAKMTDSDINDLVLNVGKDAVRDIVLFMKGAVDVNSYLSWFELRMKNSFVEVNRVKRGTSRTFVMKHDLGYNWSLYHKKLLDITFYEIFKIPIKIRITNSTLSFEIKE